MKFDDDDLNSMLDAVGEPAEIQLGGVTTKTVQVKYSAQSLGEMGVMTDRPRIIMKESDLEGINTKTETVLVAGENFNMMKPSLTGDGFATVWLKRPN